MGYAFLKVVGEAATGNYFRSLVKEGDEDSAVLKVWIKVKLTDVGAQIADGYYYTPGYLLWPLYDFQVAGSVDDADNFNRSWWAKAIPQVAGSVDDADSYSRELWRKAQIQILGSEDDAHNWRTRDTKSIAAGYDDADDR